ncbi:MAG: prepilin-type N-terminal cleavage/methylation domain-containing protein [Kiritimatiellia bacterium]|jgi:type IV pilus assembly protein PilA|nr:prepilin-type N-terminal cleavage/methylation domain-containing protein [Kiritimatiellia bacterium]MDP6810624.1 prepilin-type N-terminal cleavage/methylation domain-containing protein [Kiritimatiellia bacterium]MDP7023709.1 prepilin-type N-terminal cleavage/methylation domain-containing protein [Kiritimatiellia bacterium]
MLLRNAKEMGPRDRSGFTLVEIMIVVLTIALLSAIALPGFRKARTQTLLTQVANDIKVFGDGFDLYALERGGYPPDYHLGAPYNLPNAAMEEYLNAEKWADTTGVGGNYNWEGPDSYPYAGISIFGATATEDTMRQLDKILDDGDLTSGMFRKIAANSRYTYVLEE